MVGLKPGIPGRLQTYFVTETELELTPYLYLSSAERAGMCYHNHGWLSLTILKT